ncbi:MAG: glycosyltransferase family 9 protein [Gammaproteobacteria bacterium]|nr:glycosyltransferase family 9 protein [Gammaproteobacteria bacterium]
MSSMGDVVHTLPVVTDALAGARSDLTSTGSWKKSFAGIAELHPGVRRVLPIEFRRWRKRPWHYRAAVREFCARLRENEYDLVIDAQGLIKSAIATRLARGARAGFDWQLRARVTGAGGYRTTIPDRTWPARDRPAAPSCSPRARLPRYRHRRLDHGPR